jgi:tryptophan-rich sensory protein
MGISYGMLETKGLHDVDTRAVYYTQLVFNLIWPVLFFAFKWRFFAFIWIVVLDILVITMTLKFYRKDKTAGLLQIPYCLWLIFASYLNLATYLLNR